MMKNKLLLLCFGITLVYLTGETMSYIEPDDYMIKLMSEVKNISGWCELMGMPDCEQVIEDAVPTDEEKELVSGHETPSVALFDACNPREQTIALPRHPDPDITVWPPCTRALRCGGCCTSDVFSCEPTAISEKFVKVFDTRLPYPGAHRFKFLGVRIVKVIEHVHCDAQCKTKEHECHRFQKYDSRRCRCLCRPERLSLMKTCSDDQIWDENECDCICPNRNTLDCPDPSYFNSVTCKCTLKMGVSGEIDLDKLFEQLGQNILLNTQNKQNNEDIESVDVNITLPQQKTNVLEGAEEAVDSEAMDDDDTKAKDDSDANSTSAPQASSTTETTTTTTTTTTTKATTPKTVPVTTKPTTPKPTTVSPCAGVVCFSNWVPKVLKNGNCQCMPNFG